MSCNVYMSYAANCHQPRKAESLKHVMLIELEGVHSNVTKLYRRSHQDYTGRVFLQMYKIGHNDVKMAV